LFTPNRRTNQCRAALRKHHKGQSTNDPHQLSSPPLVTEQRQQMPFPLFCSLSWNLTATNVNVMNDVCSLKVQPQTRDKVNEKHLRKKLSYSNVSPTEWMPLHANSKVVGVKLPHERLHV